MITGKDLFDIVNKVINNNQSSKLENFRKFSDFQNHLSVKNKKLAKLLNDKSSSDNDIEKSCMSLVSYLDWWSLNVKTGVVSKKDVEKNVGLILYTEYDILSDFLEQCLYSRDEWIEVEAIICKNFLINCTNDKKDIYKREIDRYDTGSPKKTKKY